MRPETLRGVFRAIVAGAACLSQAAFACTGIVLEGEDGTVVRSRTMEWGSFDLLSAISVVPPGHEMASRMSDGSEGLVWTTKYGFVGATGLGRLLVTDGLNEMGLSGGLFYLPGFAEYPDYDPAMSDVSVSPSDVMGYILGSFASVDEVREGVSGIRIVAVSEEALGFPAPVHYIVSDPTGETIVIEVVGKETRIHESPLRVITNSPPYDWHMTNLRNYLNLSATSLPTQSVAETDFSPLGAGSGMLGLPGDFTPPSRFVRAVAFSQTARPTDGGFDTVRESFRILDNFNVPVSGVGHDADAEGEEVLSATQFTSAADLRELRFYYHTQHNRRVRMVDLKAIDFDAMDGEPITMLMDEARAEDIETITLEP